jgi:hypothetical protein
MGLQPGQGQVTERHSVGRAARLTGTIAADE